MYSTNSDRSRNTINSFFGIIHQDACDKKTFHNNLSSIENTTTYSFFKHFELSKHTSFPFFLHAWNSLYDVIMLTGTTLQSFADSDHHMIIFFINCNIFTKSVYLKTNLWLHFFTNFQILSNKLQLISRQF